MALRTFSIAGRAGRRRRRKFDRLAWKMRITRLARLVLMPSRMNLNPVWTIVLAAGAGRRLAPLTGGVPKQFWKPEGEQSLLESTIERLGPIALPWRTLTIVDRSHRAHVRDMNVRGQLGEIVYQPMDRGTAAGVLLPLVQVARENPNAIVVVTPSDHGVEDAECFRSGIRRAIARVRSGWTDVVLFGVEPSSVAADFGWITPGSRVTIAADGVFQPVESFVEKPPVHEAHLLYSSGAVWNTMVLVAHAGALLGLFRRHLPFHVDVMEQAFNVPTGDRDAFLGEWYPELPNADFCRDVLTPSRHLSLYTFPAEMGWSDLGTPDRMADWMQLQGRPASRSLLDVAAV